jgi:hypothetical protein
MTNSTNNFSASSFSSLSADITSIDGQTAHGTYTIDITGDILLEGALPEIALASGVTLDIVGNGFTLDGEGSEPGLFVYQGTVSIDDLTLLSTTITGGTGPGAGAGGNAGLGGGLFVGSHAAVTLDQVNFASDGAIGGNAATAGAGAGTSDRAGFGEGGAAGRAASTRKTGSSGHGGGFGGGGGGGGGGAGGYYIDDFLHGVPITTGVSAGSGGGGGKGGFGAGNGASGQRGSTLHSDNGSYSTIVRYGTSPSAYYTAYYYTHHRYGTSRPGAVGAGGGGLGAGGDIFVQGGGKLKVLGGSLGAGTVKGGSGANPGSAFGSGIFLQANEKITLAPKAGETLTISGVIADQAGSEAGYSADQGTIVIDGPGKVILDAPNTFKGGVVISEGTLVLGAAGAAGGGAIRFESAPATRAAIAFTAADAPTEAFEKFGPADQFEITDLAYKTAQIEETKNSSGGSTLTLTGLQIGTDDPETVHLVFTDFNGAFNLAQGPGGATVIDTLCYVRGTNVLTPNGNVPVESVCIGDLLVTRFGGIRPVKWIGRQSYDWRFVAKNPERRPVRIRAGALGDGTPARDLLVSGGHSVLLGDTLVLARALVNGVSIVDEPVPEHAECAPPLDYFQVDFFTHDCVIAEGVFAESFADGPGLRGQFHNEAEFGARYPDHTAPEDLLLCASRPLRGAALAAALDCVVARAGAGIAPGRLEGFVDLVRGDLIEGWALDTAYPHLPVMLEIVADGQTLGTILACDERDDLRAAGKGAGRCAFSFAPSHVLAANATVYVRRAADGSRLGFSSAALRDAA